MSGLLSVSGIGQIATVGGGRWLLVVSLSNRLRSLRRIEGTSHIPQSAYPSGFSCMSHLLSRLL